MDDYEDHPVHRAGKRCGMTWAPRMNDWFVSWSPRNHNSNAEGPWDHWVDLALMILADPLTKIVRPEAHQPDAKIENFYTETGRDLTVDDLIERFPERADQIRRQEQQMREFEAQQRDEEN